VTYQYGSQTYVVKGKEIIVSGGAINTSKLLMLSGVGPKAQLRSFGIPVVADVPGIGSNLRDHGISGIEVSVKNNVQTTWQYLYNTTFANQANSKFAATGEGFLAQNGAGAFAVVRVPDSVFAGTGSFHTSLPADRGQLLFQYVTAAAIAGAPNVSIVSPFVALVQPEASGSVKLASADYRDAPIIDPNYFGSAGDKAAMLWGYKKLRAMMKTSTMAPVVINEVFPGNQVTSDADLLNAIQQSLHSYHHPVGTVALGTVLDKSFRVKGLKGIRVIDSSVFPFPPTCHPQADVYALAHSAAQRIKKSG
jgi:choline dehydrogenase